MSSVGGISEQPSASAIVAPVVGSGSHILRVEGYSATKGLGNGEYIKSERFVAGGHRWYLYYYPDSFDHGEASDSISFRLVYDDVHDVQAKFTISLLDQAGNPVPSYSHTSKSQYYRRYHLSEGYDVIKRSELEGSAYLKDDAFTLRCDVILVKNVFTKTIPVPEALSGVVKQEK
jgi:speckle-type POZ protein